MTKNYRGKKKKNDRRKARITVTVTMSRIPFSRVSIDVIGWMIEWASMIARVRIQVKAGIT